MSTLSQRLGLKKHTLGDRFRIQDYADNWGRLDEYPGVYICTSSSRPTGWTSSHTGMLIAETDTGLVWRWDGTGFVRQAAKGYLGGASRTTDISSASTSLVTALTAAVTVPAGGRNIKVSVEGPGVYNTVGVTRVALFRGATQLKSWLHQGRLAATYDAQPRPLSFATIDLAPTAGAQSYTLQFSAEVGFGGTSTLQAATNNTLALRVVEV